MSDSIQFDKIVDKAKSDAAILGLFLVGSRGKGFENEQSDYDIVMIAKDDVVNSLKSEYEDKKAEDIDLSIYSLSDFINYAAWGSSNAWDRYDFANTKILVDKTENLSEIIKEKGIIPSDKLNEFIDWCIDGYVNGVFRSVKSMHKKNTLGVHLEAVNSILDLLTLVYALNGRHRPFLGYVEKELLVRPLEILPWSITEFIQKIKNVLETADLKTQQELLKGIEKLCRENGHGRVFDSWQGKDKWAMEYNPE